MVQSAAPEAFRAGSAKNEGRGAGGPDPQSLCATVEAVERRMVDDVLNKYHRNKQKRLKNQV